MSKCGPGSMTTGAMPPKPAATDPKVEDPVITISSHWLNSIMSTSPDLMDPADHRKLFGSLLPGSLWMDAETCLAIAQTKQLDVGTGIIASLLAGATWVSC